MSTTPLSKYAGLPTTCPSWCINQHKQELDEGHDVEHASRHVSADHAGPHYNVELEQQHVVSGWSEPMMRLEVSRREQDTGDGFPRYSYLEIMLPPAHVRRLAAQLLHLADAVDFD